MTSPLAVTPTTCSLEEVYVTPLLAPERSTSPAMEKIPFTSSWTRCPKPSDNSTAEEGATSPVSTSKAELLVDSTVEVYTVRPKASRNATSTTTTPSGGSAEEPWRGTKKLTRPGASARG
ncbi:hypothetical protein [Cystobacter fuscus]|uniref:hypothetical protein n=1 Tax=Cystobacter fuscus TaxID=43 RepID=UPI0012FD8F5A|nr:hypothetical protein [Cystobacter fuscus]